MDEAYDLRDDLIEYIVRILRPPPLIHDHVGKLAVICGEQVSTCTEYRNTS